jgi:gliding motility-associated protein GldM
MAGGKETPRQKMIGMMYLVLTALLALNVSKSILDAFVAIEENIQISNENEWQRGDEKLSELKASAEDTSVPDIQRKAKKLLGTIRIIDKMTAARIKEIDDLKLQILEECDEDIATVGGKGSIITAKYPHEPLKPMRMKLEFVEGKDKYDEPMRIMIGDDITKPKGKGMDLWKHYNGYREELTELIASSMPSDGKKFFFKAPAINTFKDQKDLSLQLDKAILQSNVSPEDREAIKKIYMALTKSERSVVSEVKNVHWIGKTFDHSPSVAALASLSAMQKEILTARADAVALIRSRVSGGEYSFNKIMAVAYGPEVANVNEEVEVQVLMVAFDSDRQPTVKLNGADLPKNQIHDGKGHIQVKGASDVKLTGTITILNKSGIPKTMPWEKTIKIMKPQGTISLPQMNVLYRAYDNIVEGVASGYDETILSGGGDVSLSRSGKQYIAKVNGASKTVSITISGKNSVTGKKEILGTFPFRVRNLPKPALYFGTLENGSTAPLSVIKAMKSVANKYPPEITLQANFNVVSWDVRVDGATRTESGFGPTLSQKALDLIKQAKPGNTITITAKFKGPVSGFSACTIRVQ